MYIEEIIKDVHAQLHAIKKQQEEILMLHKKETVDPSDNTLLTSQQVLKRLGMTPKVRAWKTIRDKMISNYGMVKYPRMGYRISEKNFKKFLKEEFNS